MTIQILISTMNQQDYCLVEKMNIFADTIVINQSNRTGYKNFIYNGHKVDWYDCEETGVGKSRNQAFMKSDADVCVFADDDFIYNDMAETVILDAFQRYLDASIIFFNYDKKSQRYNNSTKKNKRVHYYNALKYGAARMAVRREAIQRKRVSFSLLFGGGAKYGCGEDTLFIADCLKNKLKVYAVTGNIGFNAEGKSTWFHGYNKKYFMDRGTLFAALSPKLAKLFCVRFVILKKFLFEKEVSSKQALEWMLEGTKNKALDDV